MSPLCAVDGNALRLALGDASPEWHGDAFARSYYRAVGGGRRMSVFTLDRMATTLGVHYTSLLASQGPEMNLPELSTKPVRLDPDRLLDLASDYLAEHTSDHQMSSPLSPLVTDASLSLAQLEGRKDCPLWQVESLAVLLGCLPMALIATSDVVPIRSKEDAMPAWTPQDEQTLRENAYQGAAACAELLGRQKNTVEQKAGKLGISFREARKAHQASAEAPKVQPKVEQPKHNCMDCASKNLAAEEEPCCTCRDASEWSDKAGKVDEPVVEPEPIQVEQVESVTYEIPDPLLAAAIETTRANAETSELRGLRIENLDLRLRLLGAMGGELPSTTRQCFEMEIDRVRELVRQVVA